VSWVASSIKLVNFAPYFDALGVRDWEAGQHGSYWWARAVDERGEEHIVHGHMSSTAALEELLQQLSALV
jgi:hypothetical protein